MKNLTLMLLVIMVSTVTCTTKANETGIRGQDGKLIGELDSWGWYITWKDVLTANKNIEAFFKKQIQDLRGRIHLYKIDYCKIYLMAGYGKDVVKMSASTIYSGSYGLDNSFLHKPRAWLPSQSNTKQYLQVELPYFSWITGIATKGRQNHNHWVTSYRVLYSIDCTNWKPLPKGNNQKYKGNTDRSSVKVNMFPVPFKAKCVRVKPLKWHSHIAIRMDVIGCQM